MKIELKNIKHCEFASEETNCFQANIYIDGKREGEANNDGKGGMTFISPATLEDKINKYAKTLPPHKFNELNKNEKCEKITDLPMDAELVIDQLLCDYLEQKDLKRLLGSRFLYTRKDEKGIFQSQKVSKVAMNVLLKDINRVKVQLKNAGSILNFLPFAEATKLFRTNVD